MAIASEQQHKQTTTKEIGRNCKTIDRNGAAGNKEGAKGRMATHVGVGTFLTSHRNINESFKMEKEKSRLWEQKEARLGRLVVEGATESDRASEIATHK